MADVDFDVVIIGGGPAGLSAGLWCDELGLKAVLLERNSELGGQLNWTFNKIENYLGRAAENGQELRDVFLSQIKERDLSIKLEMRVESIDFDKNVVSLSGGENIRYGNLILATGVRRRKLNVPGEDEFRGRGILFSGKRDKDLVINKTVVVVGGGDAAFENALILAETASRVVLIHRRKEFRARDEFIEEVAANPKIEVVTGAIVTGLDGDQCLETLSVKNLATREISMINTDFVLARIGVEPNSELLSGKIELDSSGYIAINEACQTNLPNVFAIGDIANPISPTINSAAGMGATAAKAIFSRIK